MKLSGSQKSVLSSAGWSKDEHRLTLCAGKKVLALYSGETGEPLKSIQVSDCAATSLSPSGRYAVVFGTKHCNLVDIQRGAVLARYTHKPNISINFQSGPRLAHFSPREQWVSISTNTPYLPPVLISIDDYSQWGHEIQYETVGFSPDEKYLVTAGRGSMEILDLRARRVVRREWGVAGGVRVMGDNVSYLWGKRRCLLSLKTMKAQCSLFGKGKEQERSAAKLHKQDLQVMKQSRGYLLRSATGLVTGELFFLHNTQKKVFSWLAYGPGWLDGEASALRYAYCKGETGLTATACARRLYKRGAFYRALHGRLPASRALATGKLLMGPGKESREALAALPLRQLRQVPSYLCTSKYCKVTRVTPSIAQGIARLKKESGFYVAATCSTQEDLISLGLLKGVTILHLTTAPLDLAPLRMQKSLKKLVLTGAPPLKTAVSGKTDLKAPPSYSLKGLAAIPALEELELSSMTLDENDIVPQLRRLRALKISKVMVTGLGWLGRQKNLETLEIAQGCLKVMNDVALFRGLRRLVVSGKGLKNLDFLKSLPLLTHLTINGGNFAIPKEITNLRNLKELNLSQNIGLKELSGLPRGLETLILASSAVESLKGIEKLPLLSHLNISSSRVKDLRGIERCGRLEKLSFSGTKITSLKPLQALVSLREVYMDEVKIQGLQSLKGLRKLRVLSVARTGVSSLRPLAHHPA
ncbi:hypothetical protein KJ865_04365, partial [Myxococcota bacterium]|nr:hypothetical protein [Myxococcota bacterium]